MGKSTISPLIFVFILVAFRNLCALLGGMGPSCLVSCLSRFCENGCDGAVAY